MHPLLANFSIFTWMDILGDEKTAISFLTDIGLIPNRESNFNCPICGSEMAAWSDNSRKMGFRYVCKKKTKSKCPGTMDSLTNTFFERTRIPFRDILAIIFCFVLKQPISFCVSHLCSWRKHRKDSPMHLSTVSDYFCLCREVCEVVASHDSSKLGGSGKTISVGEAFLTRRKYNSTRKVCEAASNVTVFGIFCKDDKEGLFFEVVDAINKRDLVPYIKRLCHPDTSIISAEPPVENSYNKKSAADPNKNQGKIFCPPNPSIIPTFQPSHHYMPPTTSHFMGVQNCYNNVIPPPQNTNPTKPNSVPRHPVENQGLLNPNQPTKPDKPNKKQKKSHAKQSPAKKNQPSKTLFHFMALNFYRRTQLVHLTSDGERVFAFLNDIKKVFPGPGKEGLKMKKIEYEAPPVPPQGPPQSSQSSLNPPNFQPSFENLGEIDWNYF
ncbi:hypothetical protein JTE90_001747 [Oedothorax gibbosus]|uniref:Transposase n=1 Tax=Oedothorax gibbosus TaxID=931172 RepID=A0AAV6V7Y1_9ARAC|nr:hypothetical protein JTE90_001747 [Oedothorax gibbosus]